MKNRKTGVKALPAASGSGSKTAHHNRYLKGVVNGVLLKHIGLSSIAELLKQPDSQGIHRSMPDVRDNADLLGRMPAAPDTCMKKPVSELRSGEFNHSIAYGFMKTDPRVLFQRERLPDLTRVGRYGTA